MTTVSETRKPATKAAASPKPTACLCPICGGEAGYDLAPNPGPPSGGEHAPPQPPPEEVQTPPPEVPPGPGNWYLVLCTGGVHRTLWPESRLAELAAPPPPAGREAKGHAPHAEHGPGHDKK